MSLRLGLPIAAGILVVDQASKWWILEVARLPEVGHIPLLEAGPLGLDLTMVWNRGVTFGLLSGDGAWNHIILAVLAAGIVMDTATFAHPNTTPRTLRVAAALLEAGRGEQIG